MSSSSSSSRVPRQRPDVQRKPSKSPPRGLSDFGPRSRKTDIDELLAQRRQRRQRDNLVTSKSASQLEASPKGGARKSHRTRQHPPLEGSSGHSGSGNSENSGTRQRQRDRLSPTRTRRTASAVDLRLDEDSSSVYSGRSKGGTASSGGSAGIVNHEDELERIKEMRARRLKAAGEGRSRSPKPGRRPAAPRSTPPLISRKELEDAGLVRKDRRPKRDDAMPARHKSDFTRRSRRESSPRTEARPWERPEGGRRPPRLASLDTGLLDNNLEMNTDKDVDPRRLLSESKSDQEEVAAMVSPKMNASERAEQRSLATDLSTRLKERRQARLAEREAAQKTDKEPTRRDEVERRLARRRSGDDALDKMTESTKPSRPATQTQSSTRHVSVGDGSAAKQCSVKIAIHSAVDLPQNVLPNMPLCPVVKVGFVRLPDNHKDSTVKKHVLETLDGKSIEAVPSSQTRSTTSRIMSKRDNGSIDFAQEMRWDDVETPANVAILVELSARAVQRPTNWKESPPASNQREAFAMVPPPPASPRKSPRRPTSKIHDIAADPLAFSPRAARDSAQMSEAAKESLPNMSRSGSEDDMGGGIRAFWRKATNRKAAELEAAEAAAAVARMLVEEDIKPKGTPRSRYSTIPHSDYNVALQKAPGDPPALTGDVPLGHLVLPLSHFPLDRASTGLAKTEKWYPMEMFQTPQGRKPPSVLLELSLGQGPTLDDKESELQLAQEKDDNKKSRTGDGTPTDSPTQEETKGEDATEKDAAKEPVLEPGIVDFVAVVGCRDIGNQKEDNGTKGWVSSTPESVLLEQFPPNNEFHHKAGRTALMPEMVQWFCYPEGVKLWRGVGPPSAADLKSSTSLHHKAPYPTSYSTVAFDECLQCATSFSWFVIASNSDEYGSKLAKTYGASIRFYVPAPRGVDPTQEDFAQTNPEESSLELGAMQRLWVPIGICLTTSLPIVGILEAILLRLCRSLAEKVQSSPETSLLDNLQDIHGALKSLLLDYQRPIAGAVNCALPFLSGDRFLVSVLPPSGLPSLPHGRAVLSMCRLLGAYGLNNLLAAVLTECKILFHSNNIADIAMVAEVITALIYPFAWSLPYIPILPLGMLEFVEAPLSYMLGMPTSSLNLIDPLALEDVLVIDLNPKISLSDPLDPRKASRGTAGKARAPTPLPAKVASNISNAVWRLFGSEQEAENEFGVSYTGDKESARLQTESLAEREFRVAVAVEICGLLRGYQNCTGPVFNRDKFLKTSPALYEDRKDNIRRSFSTHNRAHHHGHDKVISQRSKRFLSSLVNTQNFQQLLESLEDEETAFFHEVMEMLEEGSNDKAANRVQENNILRGDKTVTHLVRSLEKLEDTVPTFHIDQGSPSANSLGDDSSFLDLNIEDILNLELGSRGVKGATKAVSFTPQMLTPIQRDPEDAGDPAGGHGASLEYIAKLEKSPWEYQKLFDIAHDVEDHVKASKEKKIKLRDALGERRYNAWQLAKAKTEGRGVEDSLTGGLKVSRDRSALDLTSLVSSAAKGDESDGFATRASISPLRESTLAPEQQRVADAKDRDILRRCLDRANKLADKPLGDDTSKHFVENGRDLIAESEKALRNPSGQRFLLSILAQRARLENQRLRANRRQSISMTSVSRLEHISFDCLVRLSCAMLDSCMEYKEYEAAYRVLTLTAGFVTVIEESPADAVEKESSDPIIVTMTSRIGLHPIFADMQTWISVMNLHLSASERKTESRASDDETDDEIEDEGALEHEAAVATLYEMVGYGIPGEELSRFAMRISEEKGWFNDERGRQLLLLARRLSVRRDQSDTGNTSAATAGLDMMSSSHGDQVLSEGSMSSTPIEDQKEEWFELGWCHPAAPSAKSSWGPEKAEAADESPADEYMKRSPVTALASFGSSVIVTGGLDGGVFVAYSLGNSTLEELKTEVRGIHLDWGSASRATTGSSSDGEYGVGAISCLAASFIPGQYGSNSGTNKETIDSIAESGIATIEEGSRVIAGTTAGDLRVWSIKDVYESLRAAKGGNETTKDMKPPIGGGNLNTRLKFSLRGRALSGHRGGVTCIDVPSQVYRPDSLLTGGADGLIKLWSLRAPSGGRRSTANQQENEVQQRGRGGDALSVLNGHDGRILCVKTAWHGDRLLSGGADRSLRVWDLSASGKCLHTLYGHRGWVTQVQYWGPNTIVSGSTDRSLALWDVRVKGSPLFVLRHHHSPISDFLVGSRTDPLMVSAASDGSIATWDFRALSGTSKQNKSSAVENNGVSIIRNPRASMNHNSLPAGAKFATGQVFLARGVNDAMKSVLSVGSDAIVRDWDFADGRMVREHPTGHSDIVSSFQSLSVDGGASAEEMNYRSGSTRGTISCSWDGTIRMRQLKKS